MYRRLNFEIVDHILCEIEHRFSSFNKREFFHLLYSQEYENYKVKFPDHLLPQLSSICGILFDYIALKNELVVLYSSSKFSFKNVYELVSLMNEHGLSSGFTQVYKLTLRRINIYLRNTQSQERLSGLSLFSIEKQAFNTLKSTLVPSFYNSVIENFFSQERRIELMYK
ncbi:hypothetical protein PR048_031542 [Dryococelus australis]|uniref:Maturase K n=1 Tax=Dryococelus australis TaxID=614101 RepID=A0ABQ9G5K7_9NEOP|nr:hypothetical protein PR048_031542 [Dryococelus australis]